MKSTDIPVKVITPFAEDAGSGFISVIPETTSDPGRASWQTGFPPATMVPIASGGTPPFGQDMNGVFNPISAWVRWQGAGAPVAYDATFSSEVGGYPKGSAVTAASGLGWWVCQVEDNVTNPDAGGANWIFVPIEQVWPGDPNTHVAGQAATPTAPASITWDSSNQVAWVCTTSGVAAAAVWRPLSTLIPVTNLDAPNKLYNVDSTGRLFVRVNTAGGPMTDSLPTVAVGNGWQVSIVNADPVNQLTITAPGGKKLNSVVGGSVALIQNQNVTIVADAAGDFWMTAVPIPRVFSAQEVYVSTSGIIAPGAYDVDTRSGPITLTLEASAILGDNYRFRDVGGALALYPCVINPNGNSCDVSSLDVNWSVSFISFKSGNWSLV